MKTRTIFTILLGLWCVTVGAQSSSNYEVIMPWGSESPWQMKYYFKDHIDDVPPPADSNGNQWYAVGYDDSEWGTLTGPLGNWYYNINQGYDWNVDLSSIFLRGSFVLSEISSDYYFFQAYVDDNATVYVNGVQVMANNINGNDNYTNIVIVPKDLLSIGENTLAVYVSDDGGYARCFDCTLYAASHPIGFTDDQGVIYELNKETETYKVFGLIDYFDVNLVIPVTFFGCRVTEIGNDALSRYELKSVVLPEGIEKIGFNALSDCNLTSIVIPASVTNMYPDEDNPISNNKQLTSIQVAVGNTVYDSRDNCNAVIETATNKLIAGCNTTVIPQSVTAIGNDAFYGCTFSTITIPESVTSIGDFAFSYCEDMTHIVIPKNVTAIGSEAFDGCSGLSKVIVDFSQPIEIDESAFPKRRRQILYVPVGSKAAFMAAEIWKDFRNIFEIGEEEVYANIPYVLLSQDGSTLTFRFDNEYNSCEGTVYELEEVNGEPEWYGNAVNYDVNRVIFEPSFAQVRPELTHSWLREMPITSVEGIRYLDTSATYDVGAMFYYSTSLQSLDLRNFNTSNIEGFGHMFHNCSGLKALDLSNFNMGKAIYTHHMLSYCSNLQALKVSASMSNIDNNACEGVGSPNAPCMLYVPEGFDFGGIDTSGDYFIWKSGYFCLGDENSNDVVVIDDDTFSALTFEGVRMVFKIIDPIEKTVQVGNDVASIDPATTGCVTIPSEVNGYKVVGIGSNGFRLCEGLTEVLLPEGLEFIGDNAFYGCLKLRGILIPETVCRMGENAFFGCEGMVCVYIPIRVTNIANHTFHGCSNLQYADCKNPIPPVCGSGVFASVPVNKCMLYVPEGSEEAYASVSPWSDFANMKPVQLEGVTENEWAMLQSLRDELVAKGWQRPWDMSLGISRASSLSGVTVRDKHVVKLALSGYQLGGSLPKNVFHLPFLEELDLSYNKFCGDINAGFFSNTTLDASNTLKNLNLSGNLLSGNIGLFASRLSSLQTLNVSGNRLTEVSPMISATVTTLNIGNQVIDTTYDFDLTKKPYEELFLSLPSLLRYNHAMQRYDGTVNLLCTTDDVAGYDINNNDAWGVVVSLDHDNGTWSIPTVSSNYVYRGTNDAQLQAMLLGENGQKTGTTIGLKLQFALGDSNFNGEVDVTDLQATIMEAMEKQKQERTPFNFTAANINHDEDLNVLDVIGEVNILMAAAPVGMRHVNRREAGVVPSCTASVYVLDGQLFVYSEVPVAAFDIRVSSAALQSLSTTLSQAGLTCSVSENADGFHIIGYSLSGGLLPIGETPIANLSGASASVSAAMLADGQAAKIATTCNMLPTSVFSLTQQQLNIRPYGQGIAITSSEDGKVSWRVNTIDGRLVGQGELSTRQGDTSYIDLRCHGMFIVTVQSAYETITHKVINIR